MILVEGIMWNISFNLFLIKGQWLRRCCLSIFLCLALVASVLVCAILVEGHMIMRSNFVKSF